MGSVRYALTFSARALLVAVAALLLVVGLAAVSAEPALANTNSNATAKLNSIKTQTGFKPGSCNWQSWNNPYPSGWTNCKAGCWYFSANVATRMFGSYPSGTSGYTLTNPGNFSSVGQVVDTPSANPPLSGVQSLIQKAYPGDIIQFKGGPNGWGSWQHTAVVESVDSGGVTIYQHADNAHVTSTRYTWSYFYNNYLDFDVNTSYNKGITLYHYKDYDKLYGGTATPSVPTGVKLSTSLIKPNGSAVLSWNASSNATSYIIDGWCNNKEVLWKEVGNVTQYTLSGLSEGKYSYFVIAKNGNASSPSSAGVTLTVNNLILSAPTNVALSATDITSGETATLSWDAVPNATSYIVDGWCDGNEVVWKNVGNATTYKASGLKQGKYSFFVIAVNGDVSSPSSKGVSLDVQALSPSKAKLSKTTVKPGESSTLSWSKVDGASKYIVDGWHNGEEIMWKDVTSSSSLNLSYSEPGVYSFFVIVTNAEGKATSDGVKLTVKESGSEDEQSSNIEDAPLELSKVSFVYNGKVQKPSVKTVNGMALVEGIDYELAYLNASSTGVGSYKVTVIGRGNYSGVTSAAYKITQANNAAKVAKTSVKKSLKATKLKKKAAKIALPKVTTKFGKAKWKVTAKDKKKALSLKGGKIKVKKGAKKGTYTMKLKAQVAKTKNYKGASTKVVTVKVKVK